MNQFLSSRRGKNKFVLIFKIFLFSRFQQIHFIGAKFTRPFTRPQYFRRVIHQPPLQNRSTVRNRIESSKRPLKIVTMVAWFRFPSHRKFQSNKTSSINLRTRIGNHERKSLLVDDRKVAWLFFFFLSFFFFFPSLSPAFPVSSAWKIHERSNRSHD